MPSAKWLAGRWQMSGDDALRHACAPVGLLVSGRFFQGERMAGAQRATRNIQRTKPDRASPRASESRPKKERPSAASHHRDHEIEARPQVARSAASRGFTDKSKNSGSPRQQVHALGAAALTAGNIAPLFTSLVPVAPPFLAGGAHPPSQGTKALSGALDSTLPSASAGMEEVESEETVPHSPMPASDWNWRIKTRPLYTGNGVRVYRYQPGVGLDSEATKFVEKIDGLDDSERTNWLRQELGLSEAASAPDVITALQSHPNALVHVTESLGIDGLLLAKPGRNNTNVPYWDLHYGDALGDDPDVKGSILSRMVSQYIRFKGRRDGYQFHPGHFTPVKGLFRSIGLGDVSKSREKRGQYTVAPRSMKHIYFGEDGLIGNDKPKRPVLYKIFVERASDPSTMKELISLNQLGTLFTQGEVKLDSKILMQSTAGSQTLGHLKDILDGIYTLKVHQSSGSLYRWQRNKGVNAYDSYADWFKKLTGKPYDEQRLLESVYGRSRNLNWDEFENAVKDARSVLRKVMPSTWDKLQSSTFFQSIYRPVREGIPLLPGELLKTNPWSMPQLSKLLLQTKHLEAWHQYSAQNPGATREEFEDRLVQPEDYSSNA